MTNMSIMNFKERIKISDIIILSCLYFSAIASLQSDEINRIALYFALPMAFTICLFYRGSLAINKYTNIIFILFGWIATSMVWAKYQTYAKIEINRVLGAFILCYIMASCSKKIKMIPWLYATYILLYLGAWLYASNHIMIDIAQMHSDADRLNDAKLNANTLAYYTFFNTFIFFLFGSILSKPILRKISNILFISMIPLSFFVALSTASRQVLIIQIPLLAILLYFRYFKRQNKTRKITFILIATTICAFSLTKVSDIYENSYLAVRASQNLSEDSRSKLLINAFNVGMENMPFGVGAGNYIAYSFNHHVSHSSFFELFANQGIVGLLLYISVIYLYLNRQYKRYRKTHDRMFLLFLIFGLFYLFDNIFYIFYSDIWLISFFVLVASHSEVYYRYRQQNMRIQTIGGIKTLNTQMT